MTAPNCSLTVLLLTNPHLLISVIMLFFYRLYDHMGFSINIKPHWKVIDKGILCWEKNNLLLSSLVQLNRSISCEMNVATAEHLMTRVPQHVGAIMRPHTDSYLPLLLNWKTEGYYQYDLKIYYSLFCAFSRYEALCCTLLFWLLYIVSLVTVLIYTTVQKFGVPKIF